MTDLGLWTMDLWGAGDDEESTASELSTRLGAVG